MHLIISSSLNEFSKSRKMAEYAYSLYTKNVKLLDLKNINLPACDGVKCYEKPIVKDIKTDIEKARSIIIASPVYNYDLNAIIKNIIELTGQSWMDKVVGMLCAAGGKSSYMSPLLFANSLILDFRCVIVPRFVYADKTCFNEKAEMSSDIKKRIEELVSSIVFMSEALLKNQN